METPDAPPARAPVDDGSGPGNARLSAAARAGGRETARLAAVMERLRREDGCPWDREQTWESLRRYVLEEAFELVEAIDRGDPEAVREECGDLLLEVVFVAQIAAEAGRFELGDAARGITDKLIRRHPHVFGARGPAAGADEALKSWEEVKAAEKATKGVAETPSVGPLPALLAAVKLIERGDAGTPPVLGEAAAALARAAPGSPGAERAAGDLLLGAAAAAVEAGSDPESALRSALRRRLSPASGR